MQNILALKQIFCLKVSNLKNVEFQVIQHYNGVNLSNYEGICKKQYNKVVIYITLVKPQLNMLVSKSSVILLAILII